MTRSIALERRHYVAAELVRHRMSRKLTQAQAAERLGWSRPKLAAMESGRCAVTVDDLFRIADVYNYSIGSFFPPAWYKPELEPTGLCLAREPSVTTGERISARLKQRR